MRIRNEHIYAFREGKLDEIPEQLLTKLEDVHKNENQKASAEETAKPKETKKVKAE